MKADLARLAEPRRADVVQRIRDSHHHLAKLFASGLDTAAVADRVGYSLHRINRIRRSPAFDQLVAEYREIVTAAWAEGVDDYFELATANMVRAEMQIADRLADAEEDGETLPVRDLLAISRDAADRFGYGKKSTNVNVNVDFAASLERAIRRSKGEKPALVVVADRREGVSSSPSAGAGAQGQALADGATAVPPVVAPFRRRGVA